MIHGRSKSGTMEDGMAYEAAPLAPTVRLQGVSYEVWCQCTRLLLGSTDGARDEWPDLYAAGMTPLAAAREVVFGGRLCGG
jgi:hypothetical protein